MNIQPTTYSRPAYSSKTQAAKGAAMGLTFGAQLDKARSQKPISNEERMDDIFNEIAPNAPQNVKDAWDKTIDEVGTDWLLNEKGQMIKLPMMLASGVRKGVQSNGFFGSSVASSTQAINNILKMMSNPSRIPHSSDKQEVDFYNTLLNNL